MCFVEYHGAIVIGTLITIKGFQVYVFVAGAPQNQCLLHMETIFLYCNNVIYGTGRKISRHKLALVLWNSAIFFKCKLVRLCKNKFMLEIDINR